MAYDFSPFSAVLLDLDGTLDHEGHALPGALELVRLLQSRNKPFAVITNSTSSPHRIAARLERMDMGVDAAHVYTAGAAAADYVLDRFGQDARAFNLATEGVHQMLDGKVKWVQRIGEPCDVIISGAPANVYATDERRFIALQLLRAGAALVGVCADRVYPSPRGIEFGSGAMSAMFSYASGVQPFYTGKPQPIFFTKLCQKLGVEPKRCLLIGDNIESDIAGGKAFGMRTILALTGVTRHGDLQGLAPQRAPDHVIEDLTELL